MEIPRKKKRRKATGKKRPSSAGSGKAPAGGRAKQRVLQDRAARGLGELPSEEAPVAVKTKPAGAKKRKASKTRKKSTTKAKKKRTGVKKKTRTKKKNAAKPARSLSDFACIRR